MKSRKQNRLREIPSVDRVLCELGKVALPRPIVVAAVREQLAAARKQLQKGGKSIDVLANVRDVIEKLSRARIQPIINGTGVIVHTNFGRAPLAESVIKSLNEAGANYNNLEFDLTDGTRGVRGDYLEKALAISCSAESAIVVNNCAAALVLILHHFAKDREVIVSRGELIQIGGGFRIPEILEASGAILREVGTTNKTSASDYARALSKTTVMILKVHRSNFFIDGFVDSPDVSELAAIARKRRLIFVEDIGSGPQEIAGGVDLMTFSGDKLLGGPQAGIIAGGKAKLIAQLKRHPLFRALRCDKLILAALQETVDLHLRGQTDAIPIHAMMRATTDSLRERGSKLIEQLRDLPLDPDLAKCQSQIGGGALPRESIASIALELKPKSVSEFARKLRTSTPAVVGTIERGRIRLDLRTIFPSQDAMLAQTLRAACA